MVGRLRKGGNARFVFENFGMLDTCVIPADYKIEDIVVLKSGTTAGKLRIGTSVDATGVEEVVTLTNTAAPTTDGTVTITLPSLAPVLVPVWKNASFETGSTTITHECATGGNVGITLSTALGNINTAVLPGTFETVAFTVTHECIVGGNLGINLCTSLGNVDVAVLPETFTQITFTVLVGCSSSVNLGIKISDALGTINVAVLDTDDTPTKVADKVRASVAFTGWTLSGVGDNVIFTHDVAGPTVGAAGIYVNATGIDTSNITYPVGGAYNQNTPTLVADAVRAASASFVGWTVAGVGANLLFTCDTSGPQAGAASVALGATQITIGAITEVAGVANQNTPTLVADAIRANSAAFTGWTLSGTGATVTFTHDTAGVVAGGGGILVNATGVTMALPGAISYSILGAAADTTSAKVATRIRDATYTGWTTSGSGSTVIFTCDTEGVVAGEPEYDASTTGAAGSIVITIPGSTNAGEEIVTEVSLSETDGNVTYLTLKKTEFAVDTPLYIGVDTAATGTIAVHVRHLFN